MPEQFLPLVEEISMPPIDGAVSDEEEADDDAGMLAWREVAGVPFSQVEADARYIAGLSGVRHRGNDGLRMKNRRRLIALDAYCM